MFIWQPQILQNARVFLKSGSGGIRAGLPLTWSISWRLAWCQKGQEALITEAISIQIEKSSLYLRTSFVLSNFFSRQQGQVLDIGIKTRSNLLLISFGASLLILNMQRLPLTWNILLGTLLQFLKVENAGMQGFCLMLKHDMGAFSLKKHRQQKATPQRSLAAWLCRDKQLPQHEISTILADPGCSKSRLWLCLCFYHTAACGHRGL